MVVLKIFNVDRNDNGQPLRILHAGEHVIGRGSFPNCTDKNISRRHIIIYVKDNDATLTLVHVTPIFYMPSSTPHIQILKKDESIILVNGDKFAFTIDTWYTVRIENDEMAGCSASTINCSNDVILDSTTSETNNTKVSQSESKKRSCEDIDPDERKKLKLMNDDLVGSNNEANQGENFHNDENNIQNAEESKAKETTEFFKKEVISDSDDEDSDVEFLPEVTRDTEIISGVERNGEVKTEPGESNVNNNSSDIQNDIKQEPMIIDDVKPIIKTEVLEVNENSNDAVITKETIQHNDTDDNPDCHSNDVEATSSAKADITGSEPVQNGADASASSSGACADNSVRREHCWYGRNCYRKNASHRSQFSHPGDSDYSENSDDGRPPCPYGAQCYRTNPQHRKDYSHPTSRPAPSTSKRDTERIIHIFRVGCPFCRHCRGYEEHDDFDNDNNGGGKGVI